VITTCSPKNFDLVRQRGAAAVFDYHDPECGKKINAYTNNALKYAWDTFSTDETAKICAEALTSETGVAHYGAILNPEFPRTNDDVKYTHTLAYTGVGEEFEKFGTKFPADDTRFQFQVKWVAEAEKFLADGTVKVHPVSLRKDGLAGALEGMREMREERHSGEKLVYRVEETP
jgi:NADPH:quinone reductase-like Zn-dependent oxidoreductase